MSSLPLEKSSKNPVTAQCVEQGWLFQKGDSHVGPYTQSDLEQTDFDQRIATELACELKEILEARLKALQREISLTDLGAILSTTVKKDEPSKLVTFLGMLNAQTSEDSFNIAFQAESASGKSYIPLETIAYFPSGERCVYAGASPTSFFHEIGVWDKDRKVIVLNLAGKILVFLDQPHWQLMERLRPLLSHDRKVLTYKITDKREKAGLRTKTVEIVGYPTVVFCTAAVTLEDQERTRLWLLSPETTQEKLLECLRLVTMKEADLEMFEKFVRSHALRQWLIQRTEAIRRTGVTKIVIPNAEGVLKRFLARRNHLNPRDTRDYPRLLRLIKGHALLNVFTRERRNLSTVIANDSDVEAGFQLYEALAESNELGISPETYRIFKEVILPLGGGVLRKDIIRRYFELYKRPLADDRLRRGILPTLESAGLVSQERNPEDKRETLIYPTVAAPISGPEEYRGKDSGVVPPSPITSVSSSPTREPQPALPTLEKTTATGSSIHELCVAWLKQHSDEGSFDVKHFQTYVEHVLEQDFAQIINHLKNSNPRVLDEPRPGELRLVRG